ncbi:MAG: hypothetical protein ACTHK0_13540 [Ginsengibacter sp.]
MGFRKVSVRQSAANSIAEISWYLESKGLLITAEKFVDETYDFLANLGDKRKSYRPCREPKGMQLVINALLIRKNTRSFF